MGISGISGFSSMPMMNLQSSSQNNINDLFSSNDVDGSGGLNEEEFASFDSAMQSAMGSGAGSPPPPPPSSSSSSSTESSEDLFSQYDLNGDGEVTADELAEALGSDSAETSSDSDSSSASSMMNELMAQNFQAIMSMMDTATENSDDEAATQQASVFNPQYASQIQEYINQASAVSSSSASSSLISSTI